MANVLILPCKAKDGLLADSVLLSNDEARNKDLVDSVACSGSEIQRFHILLHFQHKTDSFQSHPFVIWLISSRSALEGECGFLAVNLYAKSVFGEDALVNISVEKQGDGKLNGYIRIRSKTQGIALSLGDKITLKQKGGN